MIGPAIGRSAWRGLSRSPGSWEVSSGTPREIIYFPLDRGDGFGYYLVVGGEAPGREGKDMEEHNRCMWLVERRLDWEDGPEWRLQDCGAPVTYTDRGWHCEAGHSHYSDVEYFDDDEVAARWQSGRPFPANAARMDGTPLS